MRYLKILYVQVIIAILAGILIGILNPTFAVKLKPLGDGFIKLDGTSIYLTMAAVFLAQATNTPLDFSHQLTLLLVLLLASKGAAGVTGSGFITLAAVLPVAGNIPVAAVALILGIDRFMSEGRAITNIIGNAVATIVIAKSENEIDMTKTIQLK